jgi:DNA helicase-2/ATP-dependent DNA helicase PcrA
MVGKLPDLFTGLNDSQRQAVTSTAPVILCLAGAGSGKTTVLTKRIANLNLNHRIGVSSIATLTFTRLAAKEMKERLGKLIGADQAKEIFANTLHAFAVKILREWGGRIGVEHNFTIYDQEDRESIINQIITAHCIRTTYAKVIKFMENRTVGDEASCPEENKALQEYYFKLQQNNALDLDQLVNKVNYLFLKNPDVLEYYRRLYTHLFVDEFQDTSDDQMRMIQSLNPQNLFVVGDDFQAIYSWRNARVEYILTFPDRFPGCEVIKLEDNYRSTTQIVESANRLIAHNIHQTKKTLIAHKTGEEVFTQECQDECGEIVKVINSLKTSGYKLFDMAILARTNNLVDRFKEYLEVTGVPAIRVSGKDDPLRKRDVVQLISWLFIYHNEYDSFNLKKAIRFPKSYFTDLELHELELIALRDDIPLLKAIQRKPDSEFMNLLNLFVIKAEAYCLKLPSEYFKALIQVLDMKSFYSDKSLENRKADAEKAYHYIQQWELSKQEMGEDCSLPVFLKWFQHRDIQEKIMLENSDAVKIMTVHAAKGLEFPVVFVVGLNQDVFPSRKSEDLEEERRLFYVAVTRAKERLYLSWAKNVTGWNGELKPGKPSGFIGEIKACNMNKPTPDEV